MSDRRLPGSEPDHDSGWTAMTGSTYARIYSVVALIPRGRVATYGQIAALAGVPRRARQVGYALAALPAEHAVPWHRVINFKGEVSKRARGDVDAYQRALLENEGVSFDGRGRVALARFRWRPGSDNGSMVEGA